MESKKGAPAPKDIVGPVERTVRERERKSWAALRKKLWTRTGRTPPEADSRAPEADEAGFDHDEDDDEDGEPSQPPVDPGVPASYRVAAKLMLARATDATKGLVTAIRRASPVVAFDVDDAFALDAVVDCWAEVIFGKRRRDVAVEMFASDLNFMAPAMRAVELVAKEAPKNAQKLPRQRAALAALAVAKPVIAFSPMAETHLPDVVRRALTARVTVGPPDAHVIRETIAVVTGERPSELLEPHLAARISLVDIGIAVRHDRPASECMSRLRSLAFRATVHAETEPLTLDELHGMDDVVRWARGFVADVESMRRSGGPFQGDGGIVIDGPSGCGKTSAILAISIAAKCDLVSGSYARWQGADEGHLGHFIRALAADAALARKKAETSGICLFFCDELDSFGRRDRATHEYSVAATNALLLYTGGLVGNDDGSVDTKGGGRGLFKPRVILCGATNDVSRCDPAILRPGRFNRVIKVGYPDHVALEAMMRVRLRGDLADDDLSDLALMAVGKTGADIEQVVNDARRLARHGGMDLSLDHLKRVFAEGFEPSGARRARIAVHEGAHILVDVLLNGPDGAVTTMTTVGRRLAGAFRVRDEDSSGTFNDHFRRLQVLLAGRVGETSTFSSAGDGQGGSFSSDLAQATGEACAMVASLGLTGTPIFLGPSDDTRALLAYPEVRAAVAKLLTGAEEACTRLIVRHRSALDAIAAVLLADGRIDGAAVAAIVAGRPPSAPRTGPPPVRPAPRPRAAAPVSRAAPGPKKHPDGSGFSTSRKRKDTSK